MSNNDLADCLSVIYTIDSQIVSYKNHELYFNDSFVQNSFKLAFNKTLDIPKTVEGKYGLVHFASQLELFDANVYCWYDLISIEVKEFLSLKIVKNHGNNIVSFCLNFSFEKGEYVYENFEILSIVEQKKIPFKID